MLLSRSQVNSTQSLMTTGLIVAQYGLAGAVLGCRAVKLLPARHELQRWKLS